MSSPTTMTHPVEMRGIVISAPGGPEMLERRALPVPPVGDGDILIRVAAAGINAPDLAQRRGVYDPPEDHSPIPGLEVAGEIVATGAAVSDFSLGDRVVALCNGGGYAEYVAVPAAQALPLPRGWSLVEGAALPETYFTIQQTLVLRAGLEPGMSVLIHGAAGGIGGTAIVLSRLYGAAPVAVVSSAEKAAYALELGAVAVIDHSREDFVRRARDLTGGKGADRIVSIAGGDMLAKNIAAAARGATILQLAALGGQKSEVDAGLIVGKWLTIIGSTLRPRSPAAKAAVAKSLYSEVWPALADGRIKPPRLQVFAFEEAVAAHRAMETRENFGKIVLRTAFGAAE